MPAYPLPRGPVRGRGAKSNHTSRFEDFAREDFDDGWREEDAAPAQLTTQLARESARKIISRNDSPDIGFDQSINPYRGCEHGCIYCYARPSHAYMGLSPGLDFESKIFFKPDAARLLEQELSKPGYKPERIHIGGNTDPYQPAERTLRITRGLLQVLDRFNHPLGIITKSNLIVRDADILGAMAQRGLASAVISVTTLDRALARAMEPRAATPAKRLEAIARLTDAGVPVSISFAPAVPGLNDHEMEAVLEAGAKAGATSAFYVALRLPREIKDLFREWLEAARPDRASRVMSLVRQTRGGLDYDPRWGSRMTGSGPIADLMRVRFSAAVKKFGLQAVHRAADVSQFRVPPRAGDQLNLF